MDYLKIYNTLCERGKEDRSLQFIEKHHILPKCLGGLDNGENLTKLSPEEHYVAHQLLIKIYPNEPGLIYAAQMMCVNSQNLGRAKNKIYSWLKEKYISECRKRIGNKNGSTGTLWITNTKTNESYKIKKEEKIPDFCILGRNNIQITKICQICKSQFRISVRSKQKLCSKKCRDEFMTTVNKINKIGKSLPTKGRKKPQVECPACGKIGGINIMGRYHFVNCKMIDD